MRWGIVIVVLAALAFPPAAGAWPTWGNIEHGDCALAAAANWELLHGGTQATEASVLTEDQTLEPEEEGVSGDQLESYWATHGIGGRRVNVTATSADHLRAVLHRYGPTVVELAITPGESWQRLAGLQQPGDTPTRTVLESGGVHFGVIRYINARGPVMLSWGQLVQLSWWQWREDRLLAFVPR